MVGLTLTGVTGLVGRVILCVGRLTWMLLLEPEVEGWGWFFFVFLGFCVREMGFLGLLMGRAVPELHPPVAGALVLVDGLAGWGVGVGLTTGAGVGATTTGVESEVHPPVAGGRVI